MSLIDYLPEDYKKSVPTVEILEGLEKLWNKLGGDIEDFQNQMTVSTATWGLGLWEWVYGIDTDLTKPYEERRSAVEAKMRGSGTTTVALIKSVAESYVGAVRVEEVNSEYKFVIYMVDEVGIPENIDDLKRTIMEIKPAHLDFEIVFRYNKHGELKPYTHGQLKAIKYTHEELRCRKLPPPESIPM